MKPVINKTYKSQGEFERDAAKLFKKGYIVQSSNTQQGEVLFGHTVLKWVTLFGVLTGPVRNKPRISATYVLLRTRGVSPSFLAS